MSPGSVERRPTLRAWCYSAVAVAAPFVALGFGAPEVVLAVVPVVAALVWGVVTDEGLTPSIDVDVSVDETLEGHSVELVLHLGGPGRRTHVSLDLPTGVDLAEIRGGRRVAEADMVVPLVDGTATVVVDLVGRRWGSYAVGGARVVTWGPLQMSMHTLTAPPALSLVVLPEGDEIRRLVEPLDTNMHTGDIISRHRGSGSEVADVRPWVPGDAPRDINWRASLRRDELAVTDRQAERNGDIVMVVDSVVDPASEAASVVGDLVTITASLVEAYGGARHRLGLMSVSGFNRWFGLESGTLHVHRLLGALMRTQAVTDPVWMVVDRVLERHVRRPSMVVFVTALLDDEMVGRMIRLSTVGIDVVAFLWDPGPSLTAPEDSRRRLARRIWVLERERVVDRLRVSGVAVAVIGEGNGVEAAMEEVRRWRRMLRRAPV